MITKHLLLATSALAAVSLAAVPALADGGEAPREYREKDHEPPPPPPPPAPPPVHQEMRGSYDTCDAGRVCNGGIGSGLYISVLGGGDWSEDQLNYRFAANTGGPVPPAYYAYQDHEPDTGFVVGGAIGYNLCCWLPGLRGELEVSYRRTSISGYHEDGTDNLASTAQVPNETGQIEGHFSSFALMANVWYDFDFGGFNPYIGGGVGWGQSRFKANYFNALPVVTVPLGEVNETDTGFAYQVGAGFHIPIDHGVRLGLGYRYTDLGKFEFQMPTPWVHASVNGVNFDQKHHSAVLDLTFDID
jgi:opacity protein-like surface antigen